MWVSPALSQESLNVETEGRRIRVTMRQKEKGSSNHSWDGNERRSWTRDTSRIWKSPEDRWSTKHHNPDISPRSTVFFFFFNIGMLHHVTVSDVAFHSLSLCSPVWTAAAASYYSSLWVLREPGLARTWRKTYKDFKSPLPPPPRRRKGVPGTWERNWR